MNPAMNPTINRTIDSGWGFNFFLRELTRLPRFAVWAQPISDGFNRSGIGIAIVLALILLIVLRGRGVNWIRSIVVGGAIFLIFTPRVPIPLDGTVAPLLGAIVWMSLWLVVWNTVRFEFRATTTMLILAAIIGLIAREMLAWISIGSADVSIFRHFAQQIDAHGLIWLYRNEVGFNHPPLVGCSVWIISKLASWLDVHEPARWSWFAFALKQPIILADAIVCGLLWSIWNRRDRTTEASIGFALSPLAILLSGYHGNTDPIYAMLCLASAYLLREKRSFFLAGVALGAAINVKFVPVLFVPILAALCRDRKQLAKYLAGLALMAIPFLPLILFAPGALLHNVISYDSTIDFWGVNQFLLEASRMPRFSAVMQTLEYSYHDHGRWIILAAIVLFITYMRRNKWTADRAFDAVACAAAIFLILSPGFALQYLALPGVLLFAVRVAPAVVFAVAGGLFALFNYWLNWPGGLPIDWDGIAMPPRAPGPQFGLIAWFALIIFVCSTLRRDRKLSAT